MSKQIINYQEKWKVQKVKVKDLVLDVKNIRLGIEHSSQDEIINDLFINENAMDILENIYQIGYFPDEPPVVIKENKDLVVLEGNRRVVSLKAMLSPGIAPTRYSQKIKKMMEGHSPIEEISVHVATSRNEAMEYLAAKHTKTTRKPWTALRRAYFYYAQKEQGQTVDKLIERYKGVDIAGYIKMYEMHHVASSLKNITEDVRKKVLNKGTFNISTLERFYSDKYIQESLGIEFDKTTGEAKVPSSNDFDKVYSRVITDITSGIATSRKELSKESDRKKYVDSIVSEVLGKKSVDTKSKKIASSFKLSKPKKVSQKGLVEKSFEDTLETPGIGRVLWELQSINYAIYPMATYDLLRTFLERVIKKYLEETGALPSPKRNGGYIYLDDVLNKLRTDVKAVNNHRIVQVIDSIKQNKWYLDGINHNPDVIAFENTVKDAWDQMNPLIKFIFDDYKKKRQTKSK